VDEHDDRDGRCAVGGSRAGSARDVDEGVAVWPGPTARCRFAEQRASEALEFVLRETSSRFYQFRTRSPHSAMSTGCSAVGPAPGVEGERVLVHFSSRQHAASRRVIGVGLAAVGLHPRFGFSRPAVVDWPKKGADRADRGSDSGRQAVHGGQPRPGRASSAFVNLSARRISEDFGCEARS